MGYHRKKFPQSIKYLYATNTWLYDVQDVCQDASLRLCVTKLVSPVKLVVVLFLTNQKQAPLTGVNFSLRPSSNLQVGWVGVLVETHTSLVKLYHCVCVWCVCVRGVCVPVSVCVCVCCVCACVCVCLHDCVCMCVYFESVCECVKNLSLVKLLFSVQATAIYSCVYVTNLYFTLVYRPPQEMAVLVSTSKPV